MRQPRFFILTIALVFSAFQVSASSQDRSAPGAGYTLIAPMSDTSSYLINADKEIVHTWPSKITPGNVTYMLPDGSILRTGKSQNATFPARGGPGGIIQRIDWEGKLIWDYTVSDQSQFAHHDIEPLPNGNVLVIAWQYHSAEAAIEAGRDPKTLSSDALWPESILEIKPVGRTDGEVVWRWDLWDHLVQQFDDSKRNFGKVADHPERVDINFGVRNGGADWIHMNSVDYNAELDQIILSARWFDEVWIIDHSTTTKEAAGTTGGKYGKGGDLLYRWGNPYAYFAGFEFDRQLWAQHDARWIDDGLPGAGDLMVFNNGDRRAGRAFSSVDQWTPPVQKDGSYRLPKSAAYEPEQFTWTYQNAPDFSSDRISGAQRLPNGNTLICSGSQGWVFETNRAQEIVWQFELSDLQVGRGRRGGGGLFRAPRYQANHPAFAGKQLE